MRQGLWQVPVGELDAAGDRLTLAGPLGKDGFARLRGSEGFDNFLCQVKTTPPVGGASAIYLRWRDAASFVRIRTTAERVMVQEKNGTSLNTLFQYVLPQECSGPVVYDICVKGNLRCCCRWTAKTSPPIPFRCCRDQPGQLRPGRV